MYRVEDFRRDTDRSRTQRFGERSVRLAAPGRLEFGLPG